MNRPTKFDWLVYRAFRLVWNPILESREDLRKNLGIALLSWNNKGLVSRTRESASYPSNPAGVAPNRSGLYSCQPRLYRTGLINATTAATYPTDARIK